MDLDRFRAGQLSRYATPASNASGLMPPRALAAMGANQLARKPLRRQHLPMQQQARMPQNRMANDHHRQK